MFNYGALPTLERVVQFTEQRQKVIAHSIANINTPHFIPGDLSVSEFQASLRDAIDKRRGSKDPANGPVQPKDTNTIDFGSRGMSASPIDRNQNILFHDRNNRSVERLMQDMVENAMAHTASLQMLKSRMDTLGTAISLRV